MRGSTAERLELNFLPCSWDIKAQAATCERLLDANTRTAAVPRGVLWGAGVRLGTSAVVA